MTDRKLRVFAGPNGSGKSSIIRFIEQYRHNGQPVYIGTYINADDIAQELAQNTFTFGQYGVSYNETDFITFMQSSGLLSQNFTIEQLRQSFLTEEDTVLLQNPALLEYLAQAIARWLREQLLEKGDSFAFETVFSHPSNIAFMEKAKQQGYKVYLYFVATEAPEINIMRVAARVAQGGHNVPEDKIRERYYRSLDLMYRAAQCCYRAYFFDNSADGTGHWQPLQLVASFHCPDNDGIKKWEPIDTEKIPEWFVEYYYKRIPG